MPLIQEMKSIYCVRKIKKSTCCAKSLAKDVFSEYTVLGRPKKYTEHSKLNRCYTGAAQLTNTTLLDSPGVQGQSPCRSARCPRKSLFSLCAACGGAK